MHNEGTRPGGRGDEVSGKGAGDDFWDALPGRLLHETQVEIIEAMRWIDQPMSASDLAKVLYRNPNLPGLSYHVRRLKDLGVLKYVRWRQVRGAKEKFYRLPGADK